MTTIGPLTLPLPSGEADDAIVDPVCVGLAEYLAFWIRLCIGAKAVEQRPNITDALPTANVFYFDPRGTWARDSALVPSLYVYWPDKEQAKYTRYSTSQFRRERTLRYQYALAEVAYPAGARVYSGLASAVDATVALAIQERYHPNYNSGEAITVSLGIDIEYVGGKPVFWYPRPDASGAAGDGDRRGKVGTQIHRGYQLVVGEIKVYEVCDRFIPVPLELLGGADAALDHDDVLIVERDNL